MTRIESLLRREIGLDAASIGSTLIQRTVRRRMKSHGLKKAEDYERLLKTSSAELDELIEAVVVTETWFFRDREPFAAFAQMARQTLNAHPARGLRVLSVPCSTGEEPYSLAMALLDAAVPPERFVIDALDISARALERARQAVYGRNSFRGQDLAYRDRHFRHVVLSPSPPSTPLTGGKQMGEGGGPEGGEGRALTEGYALNPAVRERVRFQRENLLGEEFLAGRAAYDYIFCRNLLIYFDRATQERALAKLHGKLALEGVLFVGPAELPLVAGNGFESANVPMAFACRKGREKGQSPMAQPLFPQPRAHSHLRTAPQLLGVPAGREQGRGAHRLAERPSTLEAARQLADAGRLEEAAAICEAHLRQEGPSAPAYYLLGLLCDTSGNPKASEYYRKALYLEPNHYETLLQMTLLLEKSGDRAGATTLRSRMRRLNDRRPKRERN